MDRTPYEELLELLEKARRVPMSEDDKEAQRRSFAYGNTKIENDRITREMIDEAAKKIDSENAGRG